METILQRVGMTKYRNIFENQNVTFETFAAILGARQGDDTLKNLVIDSCEISIGDFVMISRAVQNQID